MESILILPGNSPSNIEWVEDANKVFSEIYSCTAHHYSHWINEGGLINLEEEQGRLTVSNFDYIFAKSAGILFALHLIKNRKIKPKACLFVGLPKTWADKNKYDIDLLVEAHNIPSLFIQQDEDPIFSYNELKIYLEQMNISNYHIKSTCGNDHYYGNLSELKEEFISFLKPQF